MTEVTKKPRGFAAMPIEKRRAVASKGGRSVPDSKRSFSKDPMLAKRAGSIGGASVPKENRSFSKDRDLAKRAGKLGGSRTGDSE